MHRLLASSQEEEEEEENDVETPHLLMSPIDESCLYAAMEVHIGD
jgi:hypothetical protein